MQGSSRKRKHFNRDSEGFNDGISADRFAHDVVSETKFRSKSKDELDRMYKNKVAKIRAKYEKILIKNPNRLVASDLCKDLKRCEECADFKDNSLMILCTYCEDAYHLYCLESVKKPVEEFVCPVCQLQLDNNGSVRTKLKGVYKSVKKAQKICFQCKGKIIEEKGHSHCFGEDSQGFNASLKSCFKCLKDFHLGCFRIDLDIYQNSNNKIICGHCESHIQNKIRVTKISDYFKPRKNIPECKLNCSVDIKSDKMLDSSTGESAMNKGNKNEARLKLPKQCDKKQMQVLQESLFRALQVKGVEFEDDLNYQDEECPPEKNDSSLEIGIQSISEYNKRIYYKFKEKSRKAEYGPLEIVDDDLQGFIVKATDYIPTLTLICEYTGDVTFARKRIFDSNDSIMDLIKTPSSSTSLVICPENKGNIARFISGVNNTDKKSLKKQNIKTIKYDIDGSVHILLYTSKPIKKNEVLYYDYNAGGLQSYPTSHFI